MNKTLHILLLFLLFLGAATPLCAQTIKGNVYGGGNLSQVVGSTTINVKNGGINSETADDGNIYGGGYGASAVLTGNTTINVTGGTVSKDVYGGGALANVTGSTEVNITGGTITQDVYGGGALANVSANTSVNLIGGSIRSSYGGGLGSNEVAALISGNATTTLNGSVVNGSVFGCNNLNGTPQGHAKVHVLSTAERDGQSAEDYDVAAVYGGGNLAAYIPSDATLADNDKNFAEVLIENCDNSIAYVYGGGNAAPVPATKVTIVGANAIDNAFAGGNGAGADNPGADIGYKGFFSSGAAIEYGTGIATINVQGGTIHHVYGGSNTLGYIKDHAVVNVEAAGSCTMDVAELYGGGKMAPGKAAQINITCTGETGKIDTVYGGAHMADLTGDIELNILGGNIGNAFGGNNVSGNIDGAITVNVDWATGVGACGTNSLDNVYGGGNLAPYTTPIGKVGPTVNLKNGTVSNNVYGGGKGETAVVTGNPAVNLTGATVTNNIFGGGDAAPVSGNPSVVANYGSVNDIFAGGRGETAHVTGDPKAHLQGATVTGNIFGGGDAAPVTGHPGVEAVSGIATNIFGGGKGATAVVTGNPKVTIGVEDAETDLTVTKDIYGGGDAAAVEGTPWVHVLNDCSVALNNVYGGGNAANVSATSVQIDGGVISGMVFGGGHGDKSAGISANVTDPDGYVSVFVAGGTINQLFGGSNQKGEIRGQVQIKVMKGAEDDACPMHIRELYGGGNEASGNAGRITILSTGDKAAGEGIGDVYGGAQNADVTSDISLSINGGSIDRVFGGNNMGGAISGAVTVTLENALLSDDLYVRDVYGGGNQADYAGSPVVTIKKGTVSGNVYGGGALADVGGNTTVNLLGGSVGGAYGGGLGSNEVAAIVGGNTLVTLNGSKVTGAGVFGANNLNGTPHGHVKVHVTKTTARDDQDAYDPEHPEIANSYDVPAVYGGGNLSAYQPTDPNDFAEVFIENCDNSINYVYGGGNAAPVPATSVTIYGANAINHAFAGGNGAGYGNPGADVGYLGYVSHGGATPYGTGEARIKVLGGTVNNVYGGSNTLGYIRGGAYVSVEEPTHGDPHDTGCELNVGKVYGGGNEADIDCDIHMDLDCNEGGEILYAGANNANVHGDIILNIHSGTYGKVFCGNNIGGRIYGKLQVNVDETGCWPVMIGELYACGNQAPYSVRGWRSAGVARTVDEFNALTDSAKAAENFKDGKPYDDPEVNLISFTRIGTVFGGGYGETAILYGNTHVNVEPIPGKFAGETVSPAFVLNGNDKRVPLRPETTMPHGVTNNGDGSISIATDAGSIGTIYGGGNAGAVYGNTYVNIGLKTTNNHVSGSDELKAETHDVATTITGNVFGGGNEAIVSGDTNVQIGPDAGE